MKSILFIFVFAISSVAFAQKPSVVDSANQNLKKAPPTRDEFPLHDEFIEVKVQPKPLNSIEKLIEYPEEAKKIHLEGKVTYSALIGKDGNVERVTIIKSSDEIFKQPTIDAVKRVRFSPAIGSDGKPARVWYSQTLKYKLH